MFAFLGLDANRIGPQPVPGSPPSCHVELYPPQMQMGPHDPGQPQQAQGTTAIRRIPPPAPLPPSLDPSITGSGSLERSFIFATGHPSWIKGGETVAVETLKRMSPSPPSLPPRPTPLARSPARPQGPRQPYAGFDSRPLPPGALPPIAPSPTSSPTSPILADAIPAFRLDYQRGPAAGLQGTFSRVRQSRFLYDDRDLPWLPSPSAPAPGPARMPGGGESKIPDPTRTVRGPGANSVFRTMGMWEWLGTFSGGYGRPEPFATPYPPTPPADQPVQLPRPSSSKPPDLPPRLVRKAFVPEPPVPPVPSPPRSSTVVKLPSQPKAKRISIDMIGRPQELRHLVHASDIAQADAILQRWNVDAVGKLPEAAWAGPIKEAVRSRATAVGVGEVTAAQDLDLYRKGKLQVVNGLPSSILNTPMPTPPLSTPPFTSPPPESVESFVAVEDGHTGGGRATETIILRRPKLERATIGDSFARDEAEEGEWTPSLETVEKAVATKVFFEKHYYDLLKRPRGREARRVQLERELARADLSPSDRRLALAAFLTSESSHLRELRSKVGPNSFVKLKTIGHGAFGVVSLVKERSSGRLMAMKQLRKGDMLKHGQEGYVRAERDVMTAASSRTCRWIVRLLYSFQSVDELFLVQEYMAGGDLLTLLIAEDTFSEKMARFYLAEMVLAVEETHKLGYIHRDIKPDNFLFDARGHLKIADFGLATDFHWAHDGAYYDHQRRQLLKKHGIDLDDGNGAQTMRRSRAYGEMEAMREGEGRTPESVLTWRDKHRRKLAFSCVGTNNYMAPEVLRGAGYDQSCDWWSLGVIAFEMLYGYPTFVSKSRHQTRQKILNWRLNLTFPPRPRVSRETQLFLEGLLCDREDRLGSRAAVSKSRPNSVLVAQRSMGRGSVVVRGGGGIQNDGAAELKSHPFFGGIDFERIHQQKPPFVPKPHKNYFDDDIDPNPLPPPNGPLPDQAADPLLRDREHGARLLEIRKNLGFLGYTYKAKKATDDVRTGHLAIFENRGRKDVARVPAGMVDEPSVEGHLRSMSM